jgi:hypothetical protein
LALGVWLLVEQIRKVRAETAQLPAFTENDVEKIFGTKIRETINKAVEEKVDELINNGKAKKARHGELKGQLKWALDSLLAKMERGLTIELRLAPPQVEETEDGEVPDEAEFNDFIFLQDIQQQLVFPERSENPVLSIPELKENQGKN